MPKEIVRVKVPFERETKGTVLYKFPQYDADKAVQNVYIKKEAFPERKYPSHVTVTVEID